MSIEGQGHFFTINFPGFACFVLYQANISGERLQDHWFSGLGLSFCNSLVTPSTVILMSGIGENGIPSGVGILLLSSLVHVD